MNHELFGWIGLVLLQGSRLPQIVLTLKSKHVVGMSFAANMAVELGFVFYITYAIIVHDRVFVVSNSIGLVLNGLVCYYNWIWRTRPTPKPTVYDENGFDESGYDRDGRDWHGWTRKDRQDYWI